MKEFWRVYIRLTRSYFAPKENARVARPANGALARLVTGLRSQAPV